MQKNKLQLGSVHLIIVISAIIIVLAATLGFVYWKNYSTSPKKDNNISSDQTESKPIAQESKLKTFSEAKLTFQYPDSWKEQTNADYTNWKYFQLFPESQTVGDDGFGSLNIFYNSIGDTTKADMTGYPPLSVTIDLNDVNDPYLKELAGGHEVVESDIKIGGFYTVRFISDGNAGLKCVVWVVKTNAGVYRFDSYGPDAKIVQESAILNTFFKSMKFSD